MTKSVPEAEKINWRVLTTHTAQVATWAELTYRIAQNYANRQTVKFQITSKIDFNVTLQELLNKSSTVTASIDNCCNGTGAKVYLSD